MKQYDSYKNSGIDWIGEIPANWWIRRMRYLCDIITGDKDTINKVDDGLYPFYVRSPQIEKINSYSFDGEAVLMAGDGVGAGKVIHYVNGKFDFHQRVYNFHNFKDIKGKYLYYYIQSLFKFKIEEGGAKNTVDSVRQPWLKDFPICLPSVKEQESIVYWLDRKCGDIDAAVAKVDKELELLDELKQSEISKAVTKGLNPNVSFKPSGIDWIGEIPIHWEIIRLKFEYTLKGRIGWNGLRSDEFQELSYAYLVTGQDFNQENIEWEKCYQIDKDRYDEDPFIQLTNGDILITKDGTIGKIAKVKNLDKPACLNSGIFVMKQKRGTFNQDFLYWTLVSNQLTDFNSYHSTGTTIQHLYQNVFENMPLLRPPLSEQKDIADYLDKKCGEIDFLKEKLKQKKEKLQELRQSLISEVVTGKRKVI